MESSNVKLHLGFKGEWGIAGRKGGFSGSVVPHWKFCLLSNLKISCFRHDSFPHVCLQCGWELDNSLTCFLFCLLCWRSILQVLSSFVPTSSGLLPPPLPPPTSPLACFHLLTMLFGLHPAGLLAPLPGVHSPDIGVNCVFQTGCSC